MFFLFQKYKSIEIFIFVCKGPTSLASTIIRHQKRATTLTTIPSTISLNLSSNNSENTWSYMLNPLPSLLANVPHQATTPISTTHSVASGSTVTSRSQINSPTSSTSTLTIAPGTSILNDMGNLTLASATVPAQAFLDVNPNRSDSLSSMLSSPNSTTNASARNPNSPVCLVDI